MHYADIPLGLGMALTGRPGGMKAFCDLTEEERWAVIKASESITSAEGMRQYVNRLVEKGLIF